MYKCMCVVCQFVCTWVYVFRVSVCVYMGVRAYVFRVCVCAMCQCVCVWVCVGCVCVWCVFVRGVCVCVCMYMYVRVVFVCVWCVRCVVCECVCVCFCVCVCVLAVGKVTKLNNLNKRSKISGPIPGCNSSIPISTCYLCFILMLTSLSTCISHLHHISCKYHQT